MLYEMPIRKSKPAWPPGIGSVSVQLQGGTIAALPVLDSVDTLLVGVPGTGKTVLTKKIVAAELANRPETLAVFFELKPQDYTKCFLSPKDKVITYGGGFPAQNQFRWNMVREVRLSEDRESEMMQIATYLFAELLKDDRNRIWAASARDTFIAFLRVIVNCYGDCPPNDRIVRDMRNTAENDFLAFLARDPQNDSLLKKVFDFDVSDQAAYQRTRRGGDVFFFLNHILDMFGGNFMSDGMDTIYDYLHQGYGNNLFIVHDLAKSAISRPFEQYFFQKLKDSKMSASADPGWPPMLWVLDEIDKLGDGADIGLYEVVTLGRQFQLNVVLSTQSLESLYRVASSENREHTAAGMLAGFQYIAAFRLGDPNTVSTIQSLMGTRRKQILEMPLSRYGEAKYNSALEPIVREEDLSSLNVGECYVRVQNQPPARVKILPDNTKGEGMHSA